MDVLNFTVTANDPQQYASQIYVYNNQPQQDYSIYADEPFSIDLSTTGENISLYAEISQDERGLVNVYSPSYNAVVTSNDGNINCGNGNNSCSYQYPTNATNIILTISNVDTENYKINGVYDFGPIYTEYGNVSSLTINPSRGRSDIYVDVQQIPQRTLSLNIKGGDVIERILVSYGANSDSCEGTCSYKVKEGTNFTLTAVSNGGESFLSWENCPNENLNECQVALNSDISISARFDYAYTENQTLVTDTTKLIPISNSAKVISGDYVYFLNYSDKTLRVSDASVDVLSSTILKSLGASATDDQFFTFGNNIVFSEFDNNTKTITLQKIVGTNLTTIASYAPCQQKTPNMINDGSNKFIFECINPSVNPYEFSSYLVDLSNNSSTSLISNLQTRGYNDVYLLNFDFTNELSLVYHYDIAPSNNKNYYLFDGNTVIESLTNNPSSTYVPLNAFRGINTSTGSSLISIYNGSTSIYEVASDLSSLTPLYSYQGTVGKLQGNYVYFPSNNQAKAIDLTTKNLLNSTTSISCSNLASEDTSAYSFFCFNTGAVYEAGFSPSGINLTKVFSTPKPNNQYPKEHKFSSHEYILTLESSHNRFDPNGLLAKDTASGVIVYVDKNNPRATREIYKLSNPSTRPNNSTNSSTQFSPRFLERLTDGSIIFQFYEIYYPVDNNSVYENYSVKLQRK